MRALGEARVVPLDGGHPSMSSRIRALVATATSTPLIPMAVAAVLGLITIGDKSIWLDEAYSIAAAKMPTLDLLSFLWRFELHASPYYLALHSWLWFGTGEAVTRALAVVFGVIAVAAMFAVGKRYGVAFRAALFLSVFPVFIEYEQDVRPYTLVVAWSAISTLAYLRLLEQPGRWRAVTYVFCSVLAIYIHPLLALVIGAHAIATVIFPPRLIARNRLLALFIPIGIGWIPMLRFMLLHRDKINWIPPLTPELFGDYLLSVGGGLFLALAVGVLLLLGMRRDLVTVWLIVPIIGVTVISLAIQPVIQPRYLLMVLPAVAIIVARNRAVLLTAVIVLSVVGVANWYLYGIKDDWRSAAAWVSAASQPGDGIIFDPHFQRLPFEYYAKVDEPLYPSVAWNERYMPAMGLDIAIDPNADNPRIWVIQEHGDQLPPDVRQFVSNYTTIETRTFGPTGPLVQLMERNR
jgi:mannosyltransferase